MFKSEHHMRNSDGSDTKMTLDRPLFDLLACVFPNPYREIEETLLRTQTEHSSLSRRAQGDIARDRLAVKAIRELGKTIPPGEI